MNAVGIDLGGTFTRVAVGGTLLARFRTDPDYDRQLAALISAIPRNPAGIGVSVGGRVDPAGRSVAVALNLRGYEGRALRDDLAEALSCPVRIAHDATCGLLGEHAYGSLRGADRCGYVTLSTGTGYAVRLGRGEHFVAMTTEAGHQLVAGNDRPCACGQVGCLETLTGGRALERHGKPLSDIDDAAFWNDYAAVLARGLPTSPSSAASRWSPSAARSRCTARSCGRCCGGGSPASSPIARSASSRRRSVRTRRSLAQWPS